MDRYYTSASADVVGTHVACLAYAAWLLWPLGYVTQALNRAHEAVTLVQELAHPYTQSFAQTHATCCHQICGDWPATQAAAETLITLTVEQGFPY